MQGKEQFKRLVVFFMAVFIMSVQLFLYGFVWFNFYVNLMPIKYFRRGHWAILAMYAVFLLSFGLIFGGFKVGYLRLMDMLLSQIISIVIVNSLTYLQLALIGGWRFLTNSQYIAVLTFFDIIAIVIWCIISRYIYIKLYPPYRMLLVYGERGYDALVNKLSQRTDKYKIESTISIEENSTEAVKKKIDDFESVVLCDISAKDRNDLLKHCFDKSIRCYITPKLSDIIVGSSTDIYLFDSPLKVAKNSGLTFDQRLFKRLLDIICSVIILVVFSPVLLLSALIIKLYDGGPVMYTQERLTEGGKIFRILKFRSMIEDSELDGARLASKDDDRITPYGRFIRRLHLDELPQIFNILKGDMSFVGPRPERAEIQEDYEKNIPEFHFRLKVKAGLTGYAQVYGKYSTTPYDKLKLDMTYIENYSFLMDIKLILLTVKVLFSKENSEGVDNNKKTAV